MKRIILLFAVIFSMVSVQLKAEQTPTNQEKAHSQALVIKKIVSLSDEQQVKIEAVILSKLNELDVIHADASKDAATKMAASEALKTSRDIEFSQIMTPEQYAHYLHQREEIQTRKDIAH